MPTGSGKSLTYQLAAMLRPEPTLVLSPLIALMKDQVDKLPAEIAATATFVNSSLDAGRDAATRIEGVAAGRTRLLYAAPERLRNAAFVETLRTIGVGLVVIDEVHCVSMWGHDFRPDYLFIRRALDAARRPDGARDDRDGDAGDRSRDRRRARPRARGRAHERRAPEPPLRRRGGVAATRSGCASSSSGSARSPDGSAIVYARSRDSCERVARTLRGHGLRMEHYHAGLERRRALARPGRLRRRAHPRRRRDDGVRHGDRQAGRPARLPLQLPGLARELRPDGRARRAATARRARRCCSRARPTRPRCGGSPWRTSRARTTSARVYRVIRDAGGTVDPGQIPARDHDPRVLVGMLEQAGLVRRGYDAGRSMRIDLPTLDPGTGASRRRAPRPLRARGDGAGRADRAVSPRPRSCRHAQVARALRRDDRRHRAARATSATPARPRRRAAAAASAARGHRRRRSCVRSSASPGRSGAAPSSRCCAAPSPRRRRHAPRSRSASSRRPPTPR